MEAITVYLHGQVVGYLAFNNRGVVNFEYDDSFKNSGLEISPIKLPLATTTVYENNDDLYFEGLPGVIYDSLPDKFGNSVIEVYYKAEKLGRTPTVLDKLAYIGEYGMGALEFKPSTASFKSFKQPLELSRVVEEARRVLHEGEVDEVLPGIMESGGSAGGMRAKATIAWNTKTNELHSMREPLRDGFEHYMIKFDGTNEDKKARDYGKIEYMYMMIANQLGMIVPEVKLIQERGYSHLAIKRFDRVGSKKIHMHSLCGMTHTDFNKPGIFSYEDYLRTVQRITRDQNSILFAIAHMLFNVIARNQDDHTKNFSFLMNEKGEWLTAPAYDLTYSNGSGYTSMHQMSINGKRDDFILEDLLSVSRIFDYKDDEIKNLIESIQDIFIENVKSFSKELGISNQKRDVILSNCRTFV